MKGAAATAGGLAASQLVGAYPASGFEVIASGDSSAEDWWLGPELWANRLQDWALRDGRVTCVAAAPDLKGRTASLLTKSLNGGGALLTVRTGMQTGGNGFSGLLIGTGESGADYRRTALVGSASGTAGGLLCVFGSDGRVRFRRHTDEVKQFAYPIVAATMSGPRPVAGTVGDEVDLSLAITELSTGGLKLTLRAASASTGYLLSQAVLNDVAAANVTGGIALVSSGAPSPGATYWFSDLNVSGHGVDWHPERNLGPVVGTLFSLSGSTLKITTQLMPMLLQSADVVSLEVHDDLTDVWLQRAVAPIGGGFTALLRVDDWDGSRGWDYRVNFSRGGTFDGHVPAEPIGNRGVTIATICCTKASHRLLDRPSSGAPRLAGEQPLGLYTSQNVWFPYEQLSSNIAAQQPDMLVALGDQFYETAPTVKDNGPAPELDFLYKYIQWLWAFRDLTRRMPCIVAIDDHDVFQGNLWGEGGVRLPAGASTAKGGYANSPEWVNIAQRVQCGHNPDPLDPAPVAQAISVYFTGFTYGRVRFVLLEDRKFKTGADGRDAAGNLLPADQLVLLGNRQEALLRSYADDGTQGPTVILTQTLSGCLHTKATGAPATARDSNGWPPLARKRALQLVKNARAVILSGDTHLPSLVRHGINEPLDGPLEFTAPAGAASYQRWFEPTSSLPNSTDQPNTGDYVDGFGNHMRVLAVQNMHFSQQQVVAAYGGAYYGHREFKEEGYGIHRVDLANRQHTFEVWRWDVDPTSSGAQAMPGWPYTVSFDDV